MADDEHDLAAEMELSQALGMRNDLDRQLEFDPSRVPPRCETCGQLVDGVSSLFGMPIFGGCTLEECGSGLLLQSLATPYPPIVQGVGGSTDPNAYYGLWPQGTRLGPPR